MKIESKTNLKQKEGISLIVLVITIIVMIILAAAIIISLSNNGIIDKANEAVDKNNIKQLETMADLAWTNAYMDGLRSKKAIEASIKASLKQAGITENQYELNVSENGVDIQKSTTSIYFRKPYSVNQDGTTMSVVFYKNGEIEAYVNKELIEKFPVGTVKYEGDNIYMLDELYGVVSQNGTVFETEEMTFELDISWCLHNSRGIINETSTYYGDIYCYECGKIITSLEHNNIIPEGGTYYVGVTSDIRGDYTGATEYVAGQNFPATINAGDVYVYGDYEYRSIEDDLGIVWNVLAIDKEKTSYEDILAVINNKEVAVMIGTFSNCHLLNDVFDLIIPKSVIGMNLTFADCTSLEDISGLVIPESVTTMNSVFVGCTALSNVSGFIIPSNVVEVEGLFQNCQALVDTSSIVIPNRVQNMAYTFSNCSNLTKIPELKGNVTNISKIFQNCKKLESVTIPTSVKKIEEFTFADCESLTKINYKGTIEQWNEITFESDWNSGTGNYTIYCANGTIAKDGTEIYY